jgi:hypothetical protein
MGNFRIRKAEFLNQNSRWGGISTKIFFAPEAEIVFQQYRSKADIGTGHEQRETVFKLAAALTRQDQYLQPACAYRVTPEFGLPATQDGSH